MYYKRFTQSERTACQRLAVCRAILKKGYGEIEERISGIKGAKRDLALCYKLIDKTLDAIKATISPAQELVFERSLQEVTYELSTRCYATRNQAKAERENGIWLSYETVNWLFDGCAEGCKYCDKTTEGQARCGTRKALNVIPRDDGPDDDGKGRCPFYGYQWKEND